MKYLLALGFLGMANGYQCTPADYNEPWTADAFVNKCSWVSIASGNDIVLQYYCKQNSAEGYCPPGWAIGEDSNHPGHPYYCYLVADTSITSQICQDNDGDFCPDGQSPSNGECVADGGTATTTTTAAPASDPCTADPYDKDACCATKVLASEYIDAQCCECN